jgi:hypothetical protein
MTGNICKVFDKCTIRRIAIGSMRRGVKPLLGELREMQNLFRPIGKAVRF